jgi:LuxR family maltose regulon positive regulatory protein
VRPRLFRLLHRHRDRSIHWVTGPAGSGKTTLVASYLDAHRVPSIWYRLDPGDADAATFFHHMGLAVQRAVPRGWKPLPTLGPEHYLDLLAFSRRYFREMYARFPGPFVLVLDDYEEVPEHSRLHDVIASGLNEIPEGGRVIVLSRGQPPDGLTRLRVGRALRVLGWNALRLTPGESLQIVRTHAGRHVPAEAARRLHARTDGWAAGLILMIEALGGRAGAPESPTGAAPEAILGYFATQVFDRERPEVRDFLLRTAFLGTMSPDTATALTGYAESGRLLAALNRRHYFTERRLDPGPVFGYHSLFREFLLERARSTFEPEELTAIRRRAARLLEDGGDVQAALRLLREIEDWDELARMIRDHAATWVARGQYLTLQECLSSLPSSQIDRDGWLVYWRGTCLLPFGPAQSRPSFELAFALFEEREDPAGLYSAWCGGVATYIYEWGLLQPLDRWIEELPRLLHRYPACPSLEVEARTAANMFGALLFRQPHHPDLARWAERAAQLCQAQTDPNRRVLTGFLLVLYHLWMGDLAGATRTIDTFDKDVRAPGSTALAEVVWCAAEAYHAWQTAAPGASLRAVARGLEAARVSGVHIFDAELFGQGAYAALQMGDFDTARGFLEKMGGALDRRRTLDAAHYHSVAAWVALLQRALPLAREHGETAVRLDPGSPIPHAQNCLLLAGVLHEQGDEVQARARLGEARAIGEQVGSQQLRFMSLLTAAHFALDRDATPEALASLRDALALGRRNGYLATPCWRPSVMSRLCATALRARIEVEYVQTLVRRRGLSPDPTAVDVGDWPWTFRIVTLGEFRLEREGEEVRSAGKAQHRPLAMLKVLIARGGREVPEADLSDALWPDAEGDVAHTSFATTLHRLRKLLGHPRALVLHGGRLSLDPRMCWLDVWAFERLLDEVEAAERGGRRDRAREQAALALDLYRGPFLARDAGAPWAVLARERLRRRFLGAVARLGQVWEDAGQWLRAIECYERGLDADQLAEEFYRRQIVCYGRLGRRAEARAVYERCRRTLLAGLGVLPSAETEALHRRLSAGT